MNVAISDSPRHDTPPAAVRGGPPAPCEKQSGRRHETRQPPASVTTGCQGAGSRGRWVDKDDRSGDSTRGGAVVNTIVRKKITTQTGIIPEADYSRDARKPSPVVA